MTAFLRRSRLVAAGALALALSGTVVPSVAWAQDGPEAPVLGLFQAISEKRFGDAGQYFCPEFAAQAAQLDLGSALAGSLPGGVDPQVAADALAFTVTGPNGEGEPVITVLSEDETGTSLDVQAHLTAGLDPAGSAPFIRAMVEAQLETAGMEVTEENIAAFTTLVEGQLGSAPMFNEPVSTTLLVTQAEDGSWLICSPLDSGPASPGPDGSVDPAAPVEAAPSMDPAPSAPPA